jgi:hypothetical protein
MQSTEIAFFTPFFVRGKLNLSYAEKQSRTTTNESLDATPGPVDEPEPWNLALLLEFCLFPKP